MFLPVLLSIYAFGIIYFDYNPYSADADEIENNSEKSVKVVALSEKSANLEIFDNPEEEQVKKTVTVEATAYTAYCEGCSGTTYTGIDLRSNPDQKVIAVDPDVIPLGSKVRVPGYGEAIAGDIGGAIQGNRIDVYMEENKDALEFGRKQMVVEILES